MKVAIVGVTGYSGTVLWQLLSQHPNVTEINIYTTQADLEAVAQQFDWQTKQTVRVLPFDAGQIMADNEVAFFATPAGVTGELAETFVANHFPIIDLSGDLRLQDPKAYQKWYHRATEVSRETLFHATYGLTEFTATTTDYIANPGCYATATLMGLAPLVQERLIDLDSVIVDAKSGVTGSGKKLSQATHYVDVDENFSLYKLNQHQHIPEIMQQLKQWAPDMGPIQFTTGLLPVKRGLMATIYAKVTADSADVNEIIAAAFQATYMDKPFVKILANDMPDLRLVVGSNMTAIGWSYNPVTHIVTIVSVIDNLMKGAAGQAVQNFNQYFGFDETAGLVQLPLMI